MIITISGFHGTGKSTLAEAIAKEFSLRYVSAGKFFREMAKKRQMSVKEYTDYVDQHPEIDQMIDDRTINEAKKGDVVLEGLLVAWMTRDFSTINFLLFTDEQTRMNRIAFRDETTYEDAKNETLKREKRAIDRFKRLYNTNLNDYSIYDIILNTALWSEESMIRAGITLIKEYLKSIKK